MRRLLLLLVIVLMAACGSSHEVCVPGLTLHCVCANGHIGSQTCNHNRTYDACVCEDEQAPSCRNGSACECSLYPDRMGTAVCDADGNASCNCVPPGCGDGEFEYAEECDNGAANSDTTPDACRTNCEKAHCGDGVVDSGEDCDDGDAVTNSCASGSTCTVCDASCHSADVGLVTTLTHAVVDAEYSRALDRLVLVGDGVLTIYDPEANIGVDVGLPLAPSAVSVSPDGLFAAVGHNAYVSYVDLTQHSIVETYPVSSDVGDVILTATEVFVFPISAGADTLYSLVLADGSATSSTSFFDAGSLGKLSADGAAMYVVDTNEEPQQLFNFSATGTSAEQRAAPDRSVYPLCGNLWCADDGTRVFTACGNVFRSTTDAATDMTYAGALSLTHIASVDHHSGAHRVVAVTPTPDFYDEAQSGSAVLYEDMYLVEQSRRALPTLQKSGKVYPAYGSFAFFNGAGSKVVLVVNADTEMSIYTRSYGVALLALW